MNVKNWQMAGKNSKNKYWSHRVESPESGIWLIWNDNDIDMNPAHETSPGWISATTFCNATGHLWSVIGSGHESKWSIDPWFPQKPVAWKQQGRRPQLVAWGGPVWPTNHGHGFDEVYSWILHQSSCSVFSKPGQLRRNRRRIIQRSSWKCCHCKHNKKDLKRMGAEKPSLGISLEKPSKFPVRHFLTRCSPSLMRAETFSCSPQTVAVVLNSQSGSGAHTEVDYSDPCSKLRARCAIHASPLQPGVCCCRHTALNPLFGAQGG